MESFVLGINPKWDQRIIPSSVSSLTLFVLPFSPQSSLWSLFFMIGISSFVLLDNSSGLSSWLSVFEGGALEFTSGTGNCLLSYWCLSIAVINNLFGEVKKWGSFAEAFYNCSYLSPAFFAEGLSLLGLFLVEFEWKSCTNRYLDTGEFKFYIFEEYLISS